MGSDLLKVEEEYYKLNQEVESRTKQLLQEVHVVRKIQDNLVAEPTHDARSLTKAYLTQNENSRKNNYTEYRKSTVDLLKSKDDIVLNGVPDSVNEMGFKGMNHFYKAKIKTLQQDMEKLQSDFKIKAEEFKKLHKENQKLSEEKDKWFHTSTCNKTLISKLEHQITLLHSKLQSKENEKNSIKKENDQLQKDLKISTANTSCIELRLNRANEECENVKLALKNAKQEEKDLRESHRKEINEMTGIIKKIEKHRNELLTGFKKQLQLIDNLKKQKAHLESFKMTEGAEGDFMQLLDWKLES